MPCDTQAHVSPTRDSTPSKHSNSIKSLHSSQMPMLSLSKRWAGDQSNPSHLCYSSAIAKYHAVFIRAVVCISTN
ncbi:hypothetical protein Q8A67_005894 [Cirrhinus molitorella]|uniref:Uncharacterized protein n=1 Tax=Cirrhinus molitorella TaxID=172907 RepID=A0AA88TU63_9TELE|nr:hypothetical protein Q8A67_005894 [Cirrhinus molitorella]